MSTELRRQVETAAAEEIVDVLLKYNLNPFEMVETLLSLTNAALALLRRHSLEVNFSESTH